MRSVLVCGLVLTILYPGQKLSCQPAPSSRIHKVQDIIIYKDEKFYSAFPSIVRRPSGELLTAFRRAPERRNFGDASTSHTDPNSYLVMVRSQDNGKTWSKNPELIFAHPFGGSQDPCLLQLQDRSLLCSSYAWALLQPEPANKLPGLTRIGNFAFLGGYLLRSQDGGHSWQGPIIPPPTPGEAFLDPFGQPLPAYNRGAMCQGRDGTLFWAVAATTQTNLPRSETHMFLSTDSGKSWRYSTRIAGDAKISFNETSLYETPRGDLVAFMRTEGFEDHTAIARSRDHGRTFEPWVDAGFKGHPHYALALPDKQVLLVYGYRHQPFGIRARLLQPECGNASSAPEIVLRDDGGNGDLGYPWATLLGHNQVLVVYYFNQANGPRYIAGSILRFD